MKYFPFKTSRLIIHKSRLHKAVLRQLKRMRSYRIKMQNALEDIALPKNFRKLRGLDTNSISKERGQHEQGFGDSN